MKQYSKTKILLELTVLIIVSISVSLLATCFKFKNDLKTVQAGAGHNIIGFAWSENIGWISFNCENTVSCAISDYGVNVDLAGNVSGYAWSENIGWISFEPADIVGCPAGICQPSLAGGVFSGWARALNHGGGWDGWISLNCVNSGVCATSDYKVFLNGINFEGWAWGGDVVGWVSFSCSNNAPPCVLSNYKVYFRNNAPVITDGGCTMADVCDLGANPQAQFIWTYSDTDGDLQKDYRVEIYDDLALTIPTVGGDSGKTLSNSVVFTVPPGVLEYGEEYWYKVRVWDTNDAESNILAPLYFGGLKGISHQYPTVEFSFNPAAGIERFQEVTFDPENPVLSQVYDGLPIAAYEWDFDYDVTDPLEPSLDASTNPASPIASHIFMEVKTYEVNLKITDSAGYSCMNIQSLGVGGVDLPKWNEVKP
ncbi:MAG: PKD domain-containing protein [Candidatus Pacebacteria bacterium]|nr:PKD domain-containing protein [Candidatus Paceibacterota bacterium]